MPFLALKEFKTSILKNNKQFLIDHSSLMPLRSQTYKTGEHIDSLRLKPGDLLFITSGYVVRYVNDSEGNQQMINFIRPFDILGLATAFNHVRIPGGSKVIQTVTGYKLSLDTIDAKNFRLLFDNLQYDLLYANATLQMNSMNKYQKIIFVLIELLRQHSYSQKNGYRFPKYLSQELIAEFSGSSAGYVSKVITELISEGCLSKQDSELICINGQSLLDLSPSHATFMVEELFSYE